MRLVWLQMQILIGLLPGVTVFKQQASRLAALNKKLYGIKVGNYSYADKAIVLGELSGNEFTITLRGVAAECDEIIKEAAVSFGKSGFINYFGLQRFGTGSVPTFTVGAALLRGEWEAAVNLILQPRDADTCDIAREVCTGGVGSGATDVACCLCLKGTQRQDVSNARAYFQKTRDADGTLLRMPRHFVTERAVLTGLRKYPGNYLQAIHNIPRTMRMMYVHSYQSYLWNQAASKRITLYGMDKVVEGDLVFCMDSTNSEITLEGEASQTDCKKSSESEEVEYDGEEEIVLDVSPAYVKHVTADDVDFQKFSIHDVVLPLPGSKTSLPKNDVANTYEELARKDSLDLHQSAHNVKDFSFVHLSGSYRRLIQKAQGLDWKILSYDNNTQALAETDWDRIKIEKGKNANGEEGAATRAATPAFPIAANEGEKDPCIKQTALQLKFILPSSCYATMALRELMKISSSISTLEADVKEWKKEMEEWKEEMRNLCERISRVESSIIRHYPKTFPRKSLASFSLPLQVKS
ncbi:hypothetical protein L7F22_057885 [Adiantum nelumboides]|nr:hypothetical protein [Adiantum nelumboides]